MAERDVPKVLCVDPGTPFGFAVWRQSANLGSVPDHRLGDYVLKAGHRIQTKPTWRDRSAEAANQFYSVIKEHNPVMIFAEVPRYMEGHAAAARGDFAKLCRTFGRFEQIAAECLVPLIEVEVNDWMGQMKSHQVRHRAEGILGKDFCDQYPNEHTMDAICIGLHVFDRWPK